MSNRSYPVPWALIGLSIAGVLFIALLAGVIRFQERQGQRAKQEWCQSAEKAGFTPEQIRVLTVAARMMGGCDAGK